VVFWRQIEGAEIGGIVTFTNRIIRITIFLDTLEVANQNNLE